MEEVAGSSPVGSTKTVKMPLFLDKNVKKRKGFFIINLFNEYISLFYLEYKNIKILNMDKISIIVCSYKPDFNKLKRTLLSIFRQKEVDVEVVLADDGSIGYDFSDVKNWIKERIPLNFEVKYSLLEKNVGTIKNVLAALDLVTSKYVKLISPGDYLNTEFSLKK